MKFGLVLVLGILIFSAGLHGNLGSILAAFIDPWALEEVTPGPGLSAPGPQESNIGQAHAHTTTDTQAACQAKGYFWYNNQCWNHDPRTSGFK